ncbi:hypothetical protein QBC33DRAFT_236160 [Phialemonium atrogriseum]|uniref:Uncharacterized protein n=1 Tax=Phialemonium atrogriseum TaxID=1093897 RepID=A0AAJ0C925_9PEZI|nr:uncharacterized protein QBC33DRAFT_236160 [Phialemonium atrogriseum]KAK1771198.1 hypothetical protein QBC33DRAFT_236160 [Phialemonium atrogriseum]
MPAVNKALYLSESVSHLVKRKNWAQREAGVVVVFCIIGVVVIGLSALFIHKKMLARKAAKQTN